jgi:hypothetical protein
MMPLSCFILTNGLVFAGAALIARYALKVRDGLGLVLATALLGWVLVVVGLQGLSLAGQIRLAAALGLATAVFSAGLAARLVARQAAGANELPGDSAAQTESGGLVVRVSAWAAGVIGLWAALDVLIEGLAGPVLVVSDAPIYHLYFAMRWWKTGTLELVPTPFGESAAPYFPANADVWFTWLLLPWRDETLAKVGQWPFLLIAAAAVFALARELVGRWQIALIPALLWGTSSPPLIHSHWADVDLAVTAWYLLATWFLVRYSRTAALADLVCSALGVGATLGTKYVAILFVPALVLAACVLAWRSAHRWRDLAIYLACAAVPCLYWYGRNWMLTGNPLYPLNWEVLGVPVLRGWYSRQAMLTSDYHIPLGDWRSLLMILLRAADPVLVPVWMISGVAGWWISPRGRRLAALLAMLALLHIVLFWFVNPYQTQERFLFTAFALLAAPLATLLDRWPVSCAPLVALVGYHLAAAQPDVRPWLVARARHLESLPGPLPAPMSLGHLGRDGRDGMNPARGRLVLLGALAVASAAVTLRPAGRASRLALRGASAVLMGVAIVTAWSGHSAAIRQEPWLKFYPPWHDLGYVEGWRRLEDAGAAGRRVAYAGTNLPYYLFGIGLRNDVRYVNINQYAGYRMHDYHALYSARGERLSPSATPDWDRREADVRAWLSNLQEQRIELLFIGLTNQSGGVHQHNVFDAEGFPVERTWADRLPEIFRLLHANRSVRLYAVELEAGELRMED